MEREQGEKGEEERESLETKQNKQLVGKSLGKVLSPCFFPCYRFIHSFIELYVPTFFSLVIFISTLVVNLQFYYSVVGAFSKGTSYLFGLKVIQRLISENKPSSLPVLHHVAFFHQVPTFPRHFLYRRERESALGSSRGSS